VNRITRLWAEFERRLGGKARLIFSQLCEHNRTGAHDVA
jgi:hypothetical protein